MAKIAGKAGDVTVNGVSVAGIDSWTIDYGANTEEATSFSDSGVETYIVTTTGWHGSFEGKKDGASLQVGTEVSLVLKESQTASQRWSGQAIITNANSSTSAKGLVLYKYTFRGTGALTVPTT